MAECIPFNVQPAYSGEFIKCSPSKESCLTHYVLTYYGQVFFREHRQQNWKKIDTPLKFLFRTKDGKILEVNKPKKSIVEVCPNGQVFDIGQQVLYKVKNGCWIPIQIFDMVQKQCNCAIVPFDALTFEISVIGENPKVLPSSQITADQVTFIGNTAEVDVSTLPLNECVLLRYESRLNCQLICVDYFLIKCSPQMDFCDPIACQVDETCGGIFPCNNPETNTINVPGDQPTIQDAVNAAADGDLISVADGVYVENVTIPLNNLTLRSVNNQGATIQQPVAGADQIVEITGNCVVIDGFIIEGPFDNTVTGMAGVLVTSNGSAEIVNNLIRAIRRNPLNGIQQGQGISVNAGSAYIQNNVIEDYQKTGVLVNLDSCGVILNNTITGVGPTDQIAQNGIQISRGATASVRNNQVSSNQFTPLTVVSTDILLFEVVGGSPVCVENNTTTLSDVGIALSGGNDSSTNGVLVQENTSTDNLWGIINFNSNAPNFPENPSIANIYINNILTNNATMDINDETLGLFSARTGNAYLCNDCTSPVPDNRNGEICESTSPLNTIPDGVAIPPIPSSPEVSPS